MTSTKRNLMHWGTGQALTPGEPHHVSTLVLEDPGYLHALRRSGLVGATSVVFLPGGPSDDAGPVVVGYTGSLREAGSEISISDSFFLQTQDYSTSEFMSVIGPTSIRIFNETDFELFLDDADRAKDEGQFREFLIHPAVRLAELPALGAGIDRDGPRHRLYVTADGDIHTSPTGTAIGHAGDDLPTLQKEWARLNAESDQPCAVCLAKAVPEERRAAELASRPWLGRYHGAIAAQQDLLTRGESDMRVSGFGGRLVRGLEEVGDPADMVTAGLPLLLWTEASAYVHTQWPSRTFKVEHRAGQLVEALLVHGSMEAAAQHDDPKGLESVSSFFAKSGVRLTAEEAS
ncbi:daptide biosynthesis RiPP recognition protein [Nonomuraea sp. NPDC049784]|uniref:daptide biosynthesis RiPP recognition protein n=1 Tax=Nonomuraea sp. NPDC049784 TaxID=3154361 RepID=UPI0033F20D36